MTVETRELQAPGEAIPCAHQWASTYIERAGRRVCIDCVVEHFERTHDPRVEHIWRMRMESTRQWEKVRAFDGG